MSFHFILVHGTGASGAEWTQPHSSSLCSHLTQAFGDDLTFSSPVWTGRNTYQARYDGGKTLDQEMSWGKGSGRTVILVGHSHGGSLIAHALAASEALRAQVDGVIFLATPFVQVRPLPLARHLPKGPAFLAGLVCATAVFFAVSSQLTQVGDTLLRILILPLSCLTLFLGVETYRFVLRVLWSPTGFDTLCGQFDLGILERSGLNGKTLILRSTADEAASGLATAQLIGRIASDLPALVWKLPVWVAARGLTFWNWLKRTRGRMLLWGFWTFMAAAFVATAIVGLAWLFEWRAITLIDSWIRHAFNTAVDILLDVYRRLFLWTVFVLLLSVPLIIIGIPLKLFCLFVFGIRGWHGVQGLFLEFSVEPAPPGEWHVHQLDSSSSGAKETTLAHSLSYDDARGHRAIEEWLKKLAGRQ